MIRFSQQIIIRSPCEKMGYFDNVHRRDFLLTKVTDRFSIFLVQSGVQPELRPKPSDSCSAI